VDESRLLEHIGIDCVASEYVEAVTSATDRADREMETLASLRNGCLAAL
jgi:hypothetical protein